MNCLRLCTFALLAACGSSSPGASVPAPAPSEVVTPEVVEDWQIDESRSGMILSSNVGTRIEIAPVVSPSRPEVTQRFVFRATGTESKHDGLVVLVERRRRGDHQFFIAELRGEPVWLLQYFSQTSAWDFVGYEKFSRNGEAVTVEEATVNGAALLKLRREQQGTEIAKLESLDRASRQAWQETLFKEALLNLPGACGKVKARIDWDSVPDEAFSSRSVAGECQAPIIAIRDFCTLQPEYAERVQGEIEVLCRLSSGSEKAPAALNFDQGTGEFVYVPGDVTNQFETMLETLRITFGAHQAVYRAGELHVLMTFSKGSTAISSGRNGVFRPAVTTSSTYPTTFQMPSGGVVASVHRNSAGEWGLVCGKERKPLELVGIAERDEIVKTWKIEEEPLWKREPYFLARDSRGVYYYVDRFQAEFGGKRYRVFVGRRGQAKLTKLEGLVEDSEGTVFSTERGDLRLVVNSGSESAVWIHGKKEISLTPVRVRPNLGLIYDELGVYYGDEMGLACE